eukprot:CAMPEP_0118928928 /NCGR_PEP_ID=MMETSP1169-20130426/6064_1 /TAXON_ID=36882 /ORGANISM="Pyramimonas obovata, Strain CCMP722" /LENGTH=207 /DNA_ID=CAMNT_0006871019 /DNA_START=44 /DNA_END=664 /DNA_ORIENTATION=-
MSDTTTNEARVGTFGDIQSAAVAATHGQIEHTHEVRRCLKRWPVSMKDEIERYSRPSRHASAKQANIYVNTVREDLETEGLESSSERLKDTVSVMILTSPDSTGVSVPDDEVDKLAEDNANLVRRILGNMLRDILPGKPAGFDDISDIEIDSDGEAERERAGESREARTGVSGAPNVGGVIVKAAGGGVFQAAAAEGVSPAVLERAR